MTDTWTIASAVGTCIGAVATAAAAFFARDAAQASSAAASLSRDALGRAVLPALAVDVIDEDIGEGMKNYGRILQAGTLSAVDVAAKWIMRSGEVVQGRWNELPGWHPDHAPGAENSLRVVLPDGATGADVDWVEVEFTDAYRVCSWKQVFERFNQGPAGGGGFIPKAPSKLP